MAKQINSLNDLLVESLKDIYDAEHQIVAALPKMVQHAHAANLKTAFQDHLTQTRGHIERLEQVFTKLGVKAERKLCKATQGLIAEADEALKDPMDGDVRDAALINAAQKIEHYEIASYGTARTFAQQLGHDQVAQVLQSTLDEEGHADQKLTLLAQSAINWKAMS